MRFGVIQKFGNLSVGRLLLLFAVSAVINLLMLTVPLYMVQVYDRVLSSRSVETLLVITGMAICALLLVGLLEALRRIVLARVGANLEFNLSKSFITRLNERQSAYTSNSAMISDASHIRKFLESSVLTALFDLPFVPIYLFILFLVHPVLGLTASVTILALFALSLLVGRSVQGTSELASREQSKATALALSFDRGRDDVGAMGLQFHGQRRFAVQMETSLCTNHRVAGPLSWAFGTTRFMRLCLQIGMLGIGAYVVLLDGLSPGIIIAASIISGRALAPIDQTIFGWRTFAAAKGALDRAALSTPENECSERGLETISGLQADKVLFVPEGARKASLRNVGFSADEGDLVGIVGPTGAGKSILLRLIAGLNRPTAGHLIVKDGEREVGINATLASQIGYLGEVTRLFPMSVAENIARMASEPDLAEVERVAKMTGCDQLIRNLPQAYATLIDDDSEFLSSGLRQRIGLARALYGDPKIVLMDQPSAHFDNDGDLMLLAVLKMLRERGAIVVLATHKAHLFPALTKLLVLRDGAQISFGPVDEILVRGGAGTTPQRRSTDVMPASGPQIPVQA